MDQRIDEQLDLATSNDVKLKDEIHTYFRECLGAADREKSAGMTLVNDLIRTTVQNNHTNSFLQAPTLILDRIEHCNNHLVFDTPRTLMADSVKKMKAMSTMVHHLNDLLGVFLTRDQSHQLARSLDVSTIKEITFDALSSVSESGTQAIVSDNIQGREMYLDEQINGFQAEIQDAVTRLFLSSVSVTMLPQLQRDADKEKLIMKIPANKRSLYGGKKEIVLQGKFDATDRQLYLEKQLKALHWGAKRQQLDIKPSFVALTDRGIKMDYQDDFLRQIHI